jgi:hypothetical protein
MEHFMVNNLDKQYIIDGITIDKISSGYRVFTIPTQHFHIVDLDELTHTIPWLSADEHVLATVYQVIDRGTPVGDYTFTVTAGPLGGQKTQVVKLRVVEKAPKLHLLFDDLLYFGGATRNNNGDIVFTGTDETRLNRLEMVNNTITIEKPTIEGIAQEFSWIVAVQNYQSGVASLQEQIADSIVQTVAGRKTFTTASDEFAFIPAAGGEEAFFEFTVATAADEKEINVY